VSIKMRRGLIASHIKPWRDSKPRERLDPRNGVAACPIHDVAFDQGFLTVNGGMKVHRAGALGVLVARDSAAEHLFGPKTVARRLLLPSGSTPPGNRYLRWHHEHVWTGRSFQ
jgi:putative restriction endonuclease